MRKVILAIIRFYQKFISPLKPPTCRFEPTCSTYTYQAVEKFGIFKGLLLGFWRILRCNPLSEGGYDPVPQTFHLFHGQDHNDRNNDTHTN
ncbi:MAG TPA: membrane protein insertion efficiency factor YidD [Fervidobacterium sp.]|nr:membrane protein insertion efficiency factor YidD [Fervidobacterium sp.]NLH38374.1 membrane protein insertion efficiency factor YidD [Thermotogaceae bacterium]MBP8657234.1 membrane protein insertion efficiency factor YidD [Fervidobacterium sp.]HOA17153.1 membrane protein insertion efficiency factor YidD [Fervidobacterium sp.]HOH53140.1 membrane protein insertion efficiency factor YidD [Fervidobacterium sp.]